MPIVSFYGSEGDLSTLGQWINAQEDLAILQPTEDGFVGRHQYEWDIPCRLLIWCVGPEHPQAITATSVEPVTDVWSPFTARDVYVNGVIFQLRFSGETPAGRLGLSSIQWVGGAPYVARVWRRIRKRVTNNATRIDKADAEWRYALPEAARLIASGKEFARSS